MMYLWDADSAEIWKGYGLCALSAALVLLLFSMNSWLYPVNPWNDVNCFMTVARGIQAGLAPYRDLVEQKGPLLYFIHVAGLWIMPNSYHGVWILEVICIAVALCALWRMAGLYRPQTSALWVGLIMLVVGLSDCFQMGDSAEELCLAFIAPSMYAALKALHLKKGLSLKGYVLHGALAGCVLWIKFSQLGPHFVFMATMALMAAYEDKSIARAAKMCLAFLGGMALATLPWLVYFGVHGAIGDWLQMYLWHNLFGYTDVSRSLPVRLLEGLGAFYSQNPMLAAVIVISVICVIRLPLTRMGKIEKLYLLATAVVLMLAVYGGGRNYRYYHLAFSPLAVFALTALDWPRKWSGLDAKKRLRRLRRAALAALVLLGVIYYALLARPYYKYFNVPWEDTPQGIIGHYVRNSDDPSLMCYTHLDDGFYMAADVQPMTRHFCHLNTMERESYTEMTQALKAEKPRYVVTKDWELEEMLDDALEYAPDCIAPEDARRVVRDYREVLREDEFRLYERVPMTIKDTENESEET